ncbi:hypothetical protein [Clostridium beijerinckii]|uniref:hypothetical protein n=1 Tax=Clostridium beijerinckii TaxID=1520 RepID=UPI00080A5F1A|nr:hypothetical protein [Clostridium beijerinckii]OCB00399.1 hypothetical protein BGS1_15775 [Clostridium beijerinckii]
MLDIKTWLELTGMSVAETCFLKPPPLPYIVFDDDIKTDGADDKNCLADRSITIEMYSERINREKEASIEKLLNEKAIIFKKNRTWVDSEKFFQTVYDFNIYEKIGGTQ